MFLEKTFQHIKGTVKIRIIGFFIERFLNLVGNNNILMTEIKRENATEITAMVNGYDYKKVCGIAKSTGCKVSIEKKIGIPFVIKKYKNRKIFVASFILICIAIIILNMFVWKVKINGDFTFSIEDIKKELESENIKVGVLKKSIDKDSIKNNIYIRRHDIAWIGINIRGMTAYVEIIEGKPKIKNELDEVPCNIVANKEGEICKINALQGTPKVKVGDIVKKGDIIISGILESEWSETRFINSRGSAEIKAIETQMVFIPYERDIISKTGNSQYDYEFGIKNYKINLLNSGTNFEKYDTIKTSHKLRLIGKFELPIEMEKTTYYEISVDRVKYTKSQAVEIAKSEALNEVHKRLLKTQKVIATNFEIHEGAEGVTCYATVQYIEEIGVKEKLEG